MREIRGILPPITTPFKNDRVSVEQLKANLKIYDEFEFGGYTVLGSNGEAVFLHEIEKVQMITAARHLVPEEKTLIVGAGLESISATVHFGNLAADLGADALLVLTPHYYRKHMTDQALVNYFRAVADVVHAPLLIYNVPPLTGVTISVEAVAELSRHNNIIGIKDSSGDLDYMHALCSNLPKEFTIICGNAGIFAQALLAGAKGGILGVANVIPEPLLQLYNFVVEGRKEEAVKMQDELTQAINLIIGDTGVAGVKAGMNQRGLYGGIPRLPLLPARDETVRKIGELLDAMVAEKQIPDKLLKA